MNNHTIRMAKWKKLSKIFGFTPKLEGISSVATKTIVLDIFWLEDQFPDVGDQSFADYITKKYGKETKKLIEDLI